MHRIVEFIERHSLAIVVTLCGLVAGVLRWDFAVEQHPPALYLVQDMASYQALGEALWSRPREAWDTFTPIGYPLFLAVVGDVERLGGIQALLGALTASITSYIAYQIDASKLAALIAGLVCALYAPFIFYTGLVLTETLCAFLLALSVALMLGAMHAERGAWSMAAGFCLAAAMLVRPSLLMALPFLIGVAIYVFRRWRKRALAWTLLACAALLVPASVHTSTLLGRPAIVSSNGGVNFYLAHADCRSLRSTSGGRVVKLSTHYARTHLAKACVTDRPFIDEQHFYRQGMRELVAHPSRLLRAFDSLGEGLGLGPHRPFPYQSYWPGSMEYEEVLNTFSSAFFWCLLLPALLHVIIRVRRGRAGRLVSSVSKRWALWAIIAGIVVVLYAFNGNPRIRLSSDPITIALAASAAAAALSSARRVMKKRQA